MRTLITRRYHFEAAHFLPHVAPDHKCRRMHGHNYVAEISVAGAIDERGFILDFFELDLVIAPLLKAIDHRLLNEVRGLENPTAELIATWFLLQVAKADTVRIYETPECWAEAAR
jgi:6-pyruvoyltetrahydropterin/6-carboxytetrahydropterin synthase